MQQRLDFYKANPQAIKPGTNMPAPGLSGQEVTDITAYLETLR